MQYNKGSNNTEHKSFRMPGWITIAIVLVIGALALGQAVMGGDTVDYDRFIRDHEAIDITELKNRGNGCLDRGQNDSAMAWYRMAEARPIERLSAADKKALCAVLNNIGYCYYFNSHDYITAYSYFLKAQALADKIGFDDMRGCLDLNFSNIHWSLRDFDATQECLLSAIPAAAEAKDYSVLVISMNNLLNVKTVLGQYDDISDMARIFRSTPLKGIELADYVDHLLRAYERVCQGRYAEARMDVEKARSLINTRINTSSYQDACLMMLAEIARLEGRYSDALDIHGSAEHLSKQNDGPPEDLVDNIYARARVYRDMERPDLVDREMLAYYRICYENFGAKAAGVIHDLKSRMAIEESNEQLRNEVRHRQTIITVSVMVTIAMLIVIGLLVWVWRKNVRERQLLDALYQRALANAAQPDAEPTSGASQTADTCQEETAEEPPADTEERLLVQRAAAMLEDSPEALQTSFTIDRLAELLGVSVRRVSQAINGIGGKNFATMLAERRVREACRRIADVDTYGRYTLTAIAESVGFQSRTNFSSVFKRTTGLTPTEFQRAARRRAAADQLDQAPSERTATTPSVEEID